jgi:hypothetical protein
MDEHNRARVPPRTVIERGACWSPGARRYAPHMRDPRCQLTAQELIYAATALRAEARRAELQAIDPQYQCSRAIFESAAKAYAELAEKLTHIAGRVLPPSR